MLEVKQIWRPLYVVAFCMLDNVPAELCHAILDLLNIHVFYNGACLM